MKLRLDDLQKVFNAAWWKACGEQGARAGIRAVVVALRDEIMACTMLGEPQYLVKLHVQMAFNEILGSDAGEKAAPKTLLESVEEAAAKPVPYKPNFPAADPSPAVCEWTTLALDAMGYGWMDSACGLREFHERKFISSVVPLHCPQCSKPITFKEPTR